MFIKTKIINNSSLSLLFILRGASSHNVIYNNGRPGKLASNRQFLHFSSSVIYIITDVCPSLAVWRGRLNFLSLYLFGNELRDLLFHVLCQIGYPAEICCERSRNSSKSPSSLGPNSFSMFAKRTQSKKNGFAKDISTMGIW